MKIPFYLLVLYAMFFFLGEYYYASTGISAALLLTMVLDKWREQFNVD